MILRGTVNVRKRGVSLVTLEEKKNMVTLEEKKNTCHCRNDSRKEVQARTEKRLD